MNVTNAQILESFIALVDSAALGYPVAWPGVTFVPPASGIWLQVSFMPNGGVQDGIANDATVLAQGMFQIMVATRPGAGAIGITTVADTVVGALNKGVILSAPVRITRTPYQSPRIDEPGRMYIPITIEYSG